MDPASLLMSVMFVAVVAMGLVAILVAGSRR
jgi:hypothetical protein